MISLIANWIGTLGITAIVLYVSYLFCQVGTSWSADASNAHLPLKERCMSACFALGFLFGGWAFWMLAMLYERDYFTRPFLQWIGVMR